MPGAALRSDLEHAALEGSAVPIEEQGRKRTDRVCGDVAEHGAMEFDRDGLRVIGIVALGHELQSVAGLELAQDQRAIVVLEPGDMEREQIAGRLVHDGTPFKPHAAPCERGRFHGLKVRPRADKTSHGAGKVVSKQMRGLIWSSAAIH